MWRPKQLDKWKQAREAYTIKKECKLEMESKQRLQPWFKRSAKCVTNMRMTKDVVSFMMDNTEICTDADVDAAAPHLRVAKCQLGLMICWVLGRTWLGSRLVEMRSVRFFGSCRLDPREARVAWQTSQRYGKKNEYIARFGSPVYTP